MLEVKSYRSNNDPRSSTVAFVSFYISEWGLYLNCCRYVRKKNGGFFVAFPSFKVDRGQEGETFHPYYCFDKDKNDRFQSSAQKAIQSHIEKINNG